jgi:transforming growth factor-beta-induced protein
MIFATKTISYFLLGLLITVLTVHAQESEEGASNSSSCQTAYGVICNTDGLNEFCNLVTEVGLQDTLNGGGEMTVFAPLNGAVQSLRNEVGNDEEALRDIVEYHIYDTGAVYMTDASCESPQNLLRMTTGRDSRTICVGEVPTYQKGGGNSDESKPVLVNVDLPACNGVVHTIDRALLPHGASSYDVQTSAGAAGVATGSIVVALATAAAAAAAIMDVVPALL